MRRPLIYSLLLHLMVFTVAYFGVPAPDPDMLPVESPMTVDIVTVAEKTNAPAASEKPKPTAKPMPDRAAKPPPPLPAVRPEAPPPEPEPESEVAKLVPPKAKPTPAARPEKAETPIPEPKPSPKPAKAEPKQKPEPEKKTEPEKKKLPPSTFESVLKTVEQLKAQPPKSDEKPERKPEEQQSEPALESQIAKALGKSAEPYDEGLPVTMSEIEAVRRQIERCWNLPAGAKDADSLVVSIRVEMNIDGTPRTAVVTDQSRMRVDPFYRSAAESAVRAVLNPRCHPFTLPREKFSRWKTMTLVFNPKEMFGT
jgi:hypothetical protein